jgi:hypothetical protein
VSQQVSGHSHDADGKPDDESLLYIARNICSPVLDPHKWEWPEILITSLRIGNQAAKVVMIQLLS